MRAAARPPSRCSSARSRCCASATASSNARSRISCDVARENDALGARVLAHGAPADRARTIAPPPSTAIEAALREDFGAGQSVLVLTAGRGAGRPRRKPLPARRRRRSCRRCSSFETLFTAGKPRCGQLRDSQREFLFGADAAEVGSVALVPLGDEGPPRPARLRLARPPALQSDDEHGFPGAHRGADHRRPRRGLMQAKRRRLDRALPGPSADRAPALAAHRGRLPARPRRAGRLLRPREARRLEAARQFPRAHLRRARASRRPRAAQRPAAAVGAARLLQLPDPRRRDRGEPGRRDPRAEGREAPAEDARRGPGREPAGEARRPTRSSRRDLAMLELLYSSGLRLAELAGLDVADLDLADRTVRVLGKGAKTRIAAGRQQGRRGAARLARASARRLRGRAARLFVGQNGAAPRRARDPAADRPLGRRAVSTCTCTRTCCAIPSRRTCSNRAGTCAACRNCSGTPTSARHRSTRTLISSTWPASTTNPIRAPDGASN